MPYFSSMMPETLKTTGPIKLCLSGLLNSSSPLKSHPSYSYFALVVISASPRTSKRS